MEETMRNLTEGDLTDAVLSKLAGTSDARLKQIMTALIAHLHAFVREVELTEEEWAAGIRFLTACGHMCDDKRQELILLSDTLGVSMLVDAINHRSPEGVTESTVFGPFYVHGAPELPLGADIAGATAGERAVVQGRVLDEAGRPIPGAQLDVWQAAPTGLYDVQDPSQPAMNLRGKFRTDVDGRFWFRTVKPVAYPIPTDGPVGRMLQALGRHPWRPAHIHFIVSADGFAPVTTHLFAAGDPYLDSDAVFGVKSSLVVGFQCCAVGPMPDGTMSDAPFLVASYDFALKRAAKPPRVPMRDRTAAGQT
jgi:hydroxyquinol 1,2-dioxygenase